MLDAICCIMLSSGRLNQALSIKLFRAARAAVLEDRRIVIIDEDDCGGAVRTDMKVASIGGISGILFNGKLDSDNGSVEIEFIVRRRDLEQVDVDDLVGVYLQGGGRQPSSRTLN